MRLRARGALAAAALVAASLVWTHGPVAGAPAPARRLLLTGQSPYVTPGGELLLRVHIDRSGSPTPTDVGVTIYRPVETRSEFEETLHDRISRSSVSALSVPLASLAPDANGDATVHVPLDLGTDDAVYPVRVELRDRTATALERLVTHLVYVGGSHTGPKLGLALVMPVAAPLTLPSEGQRDEPPVDDLLPSIQALEADRALPYTLAPKPETLASLAASNEDRADRAVDSLRRLTTDHPVVGGAYVPVNLPALLANGLGEEITDQLDRGSTTVTDVLRTRPDTKTWVATEPLDPESVDDLVHRGYERVVATDGVLEPVPDLSVTLSRPFSLAGRAEDLPAAVADAGLSSYFDDEPDQALAANHLLADLAVLWLDSPASNRRAVVAMPPPGWKANRAFLDTLAAGLAQNPTAEAVSLDTAFSAISPALTARGSALVRHPAAVPPGDGFAEVAGDLRQARRRVTSLATILDTPSAVSSLLDERLLAAQSAELDGAKARRSYVSGVETSINDQLSQIQMPSGRSITLTARRGQIPVTFQNRTGAPAKVVVTVQSDKLEFPGGTTRPLELARRNTTERFPVVARTSGAFPLRITLESPDGNLLIGRTRLTVRSTAASRVSVIVSASALLFLAVWWARHIARGRRAGRLVPA